MHRMQGICSIGKKMVGGIAEFANEDTLKEQTYPPVIVINYYIVILVEFARESEEERKCLGAKNEMFLYLNE
jgi:hypothetical protein